MGDAGEVCEVGAAGKVAEAGEVGLEGHPRPTHGIPTLAPDGHDRQVARVVQDLATGEADRVRVERAGQAAVGRDQDEQARATLANGEERASGPDSWIT